MHFPLLAVAARDGYAFLSFDLTLGKNRGKTYLFVATGAEIRFHDISLLPNPLGCVKVAVDILEGSGSLLHGNLNAVRVSKRRSLDDRVG